MHPKDGHLNLLTLVIYYILAAVCILFLILTYVKIIQIRRLSLNLNSYLQQMTLRQIPNEHIISEPTSRFENRGLTSAILDSLPVTQHHEEFGNGGLTSAIIDSLPVTQHHEEIGIGNGGLTSAVIDSLPAVRYGHGSTADCAVCLGEFSRGEWLRLLPNCAHPFHVYCIDTWLRSHSTCPLCRANVLYDLDRCAASSVSMVASLETARREDPKRSTMTRCTSFDSNPNGSVPGVVSPVIGSRHNRQTLQNRLERAHTCEGESSTVDHGISRCSSHSEQGEDFLQQKRDSHRLLSCHGHHDVT